MFFGIVFRRGKQTFLILLQEKGQIRQKSGAVIGLLGVEI